MRLTEARVRRIVREVILESETKTKTVTSLDQSVQDILDTAPKAYDLDRLKPVVKRLLTAALSESEQILSTEMAEIERYSREGLTDEWVTYAQTPEGKEMIRTGWNGSWTPGRVEPDEQDAISATYLGPMWEKLHASPSKSTRALALMIQGAMNQTAARFSSVFSHEDLIQQREDAPHAFGQFINTNEISDITYRLTEWITYMLLAKYTNDGYNVATSGLGHGNIDDTVEHLVMKPYYQVIGALFSNAQKLADNPDLSDDQISELVYDVQSGKDKIKITRVHMRPEYYDYEKMYKLLIRIRDAARSRQSEGGE